MFRDQFDGVVWIDDLRVWVTACLIPSPKLLQIVHLRGSSQLLAGLLWTQQQIHVMTHQPNNPRRHPTIEQIRTDSGMITRLDRFADIMEQSSRPHLWIETFVLCVLEDLEGVEKDIPFGMMDGILWNAIQRPQQIRQRL